MSPNKEQLKRIIAGGDDKNDNVLILNTLGEFQLVKGAGYDAVKDLEFVTRWGTFDANNGYVGEEAAKCKYLIDTVIMEWANEAWKIHCETGRCEILNLNS